MSIVRFSEAKAIFHPTPAGDEAAVSQYGFYKRVELPRAAQQAVIRLTARNVYRLYINGEIVMHGPARTAKGYCRVDETDIISLLTEGVNHIAVEVMAYGGRWAGYHGYSNDSTLEAGLFIAEIEADGRILTATGRDAWQVCRLTAREPVSERISHSRECVEIYRLDGAYTSWRVGQGELCPAVLVEEPTYLSRQALRPTLQAHDFDRLLDFGAVCTEQDKELDPFFYEGDKAFRDALPEHPTADCRRTVENPDGSVRADRSTDGLTLSPVGTQDFCALWDGGESCVGFVRVVLTCEQAGTLDILRSEMIMPDGEIPFYYNQVTRLHLPAGRTEFVAMEPGLARYLKLFFRGLGRVTVHGLSMLEDCYPDEQRAAFLCNDEQLNGLFCAAKKTLLLNTLDVFMDCPDRERGGWLCDSLWTGRAAAMMLADPRVEREMLENFLLTPAKDMGHAFFPEVYPGTKADYAGLAGITTWSFWMMCELCEYIERTGDIAFRDEYKPRVDAFVKGTRDFMGESGLLTHMPAIFIDWSLSNHGDHTQPISTAANALYAYMMTALGKTFGESSWTRSGEEVRAILRRAVTRGQSPAEMKYIPDSLGISEQGELIYRDYFSEAAMYTSLWCGLFTPEEAPLLYRGVRDKMGPAPIYAKDPNVGGSQLFIGLCIRLDMLSRMGAMDKMTEDMLAIYLPQLREGPGTLWENRIIDTSSRCHGFTSHAGVHLMRDILGLGFALPEEDVTGKRVVEISPHICGLRWARGTTQTPEGIISVDWRYDGETFSLRVCLPAAYACRVTLPREARALDGDKVSVKVTAY